MTSGGSSDTELNELAVKPTNPCAARAVMIVTPVANCARASRNCRSAMAGRLRSWVGIVTHRAPQVKAVKCRRILGGSDATCQKRRRPHGYAVRARAAKLCPDFRT